MSNQAVEDLVIVGGIAIAAYLILQKLNSGVASLTNPLSTGAANAFVNLTSGPGAQATGSVRLPDGSSIPMADITITNMSTNQASYGGSTYTLSEDANGDYVLN